MSEQTYGDTIIWLHKRCCCAAATVAGGLTGWRWGTIPNQTHHVCRGLTLTRYTVAVAETE